MVGFLDRCAFSTTTEGDGTIDVGPALGSDFFTPDEAGAVDGVPYDFIIEEGGDIELVTGVFGSSGTTLTRDTVIRSKIGGTAGTAKMDLTGTARVRIIASFGGLKAEATDTERGLVEKATNAEVRSSAADKYVSADRIEGASAPVALAEVSGAVAVDWDTFINGEVTVDQATVISNPTNGQPGTYRTLMVQGNDGTDRAITFGNQFLGDVPTITDCDSAKWYQLSLYCHTTTHFVVSAKVAKI